MKLLAIDQPDKEFTTFLEPLEAALEHEKYVTSLINDIYAAAAEVKDYRTMKFLDWFIEEQQEEEDNADKMITRMKLSAPMRRPCTTSIRRTPRACTPCRPRWLLRNRPQASPSYRAPAHAGDGLFFVYSEPRYCQKSRADDESGAPLRFMP